MKTPLDPRHKKRQKIVIELFATSFEKQPVSDYTKKVLARLSRIDKIIEKAAPEFPIGGINKIDLAILRLAVFELLFEKHKPPKVIIDEAIELGKEFGGDTSPAFINGALAKVYER